MSLLSEARKQCDIVPIKYSLRNRHWNESRTRDFSMVDKVTLLSHWKIFERKKSNSTITTFM